MRPGGAAQTLRSRPDPTIRVRSPMVRRRKKVDIFAAVCIEGGLKGDLIHIKARKNKHGARAHWGKHEWAQAAIGLLLQHGKLPDFSRSRAKAKLVKKINEQLNRDPAYRALGWGPLSRNTILAAAKAQGILPAD